jgi:hypothetical protein
LAAYLSLALLGVGIGWSQDKNQFSLQTAPEALAQGVDFSLSQQPVLQHYQTLPFSLILNNAVDNKASGNFNMGNFKIPTKQEMYSSYFNAAVALAKGDEQSRQKSVDYLIKAIELDPVRAMKQAAGLDDVTKQLCAKAFASKAWPAIEEQLKEKKGFLEKNWWWMLLLAIGAGVGIYELTKPKPKPATPVEQDYKTNLNFRVFNHTQGELKVYTLENIMTSSSVTIRVSDLGVSGVDPNRMALRGAS